MTQSSSFDADVVSFVTKTGINEPTGGIAIPHALGAPPEDAFIVDRSAAVILNRGATAWSDTHIYLTADTEGVVVTLIIFGRRSVAAASPPQKLILTGTYTGDNVSSRDILCTGVTPVAVFLQRRNNSGTDGHPMYWRTTAMDTGACKGLEPTNASFTDAITAFSSNSFTVGANRGNNANSTYFWIAFAANPGVLKIGTYTGNGADDRNITGVGFLPEFVLTVAHTVTNNAQNAIWRIGGGPAGDSAFPIHSIGALTNRIQALQADGFQVGTATDTNRNTEVYYYFALKSVTGSITSGSYTGTGVDGLDVVQTDPFQPDWVWVKRTNTNRLITRISSMVGDLSVGPWNSTNGTGVTGVNRIQAMNTDGFEVGTDATVNAVATYYYFSCKDGSGV